MKTWVTLLAAFSLISASWAANEQKQAGKLDKELKKISLAAADPDGRRVVNRVMAEQLKVSRTQLVAQRKQTGFVYGQLFAAHVVARQAKMNFDQVAAAMKKGQSLLAISESKNLDLQPILAAAKKMNKALNSELDKVADGQENEQADDSADDYDPSDDSLLADTSSFTPSELAQAQATAQQRAQAAMGRAGGMGNGMGAGSMGTSGMGTGGGMTGMGSARGRGPGR